MNLTPTNKIFIVEELLDSKVYKDKLYVKLKSSNLRNEFSYRKTDIINQINSRVGKKLIVDIIFK